MTLPVFDPSDGAWVIHTGFTIDADGSARAYGPHDTGLDFTANGGLASDPYGYELNPKTGKPYIQGVDAPAFSQATRGMYVSSTTYQRAAFRANDPRRYLNSETERFGVVTGSFRKHVHGTVLGCRMVVSYKGKQAIAVAGDVGPAFGEGSIALADALGIPSNPRTGGCEEGVTWRIYPGITAPGYELQRYRA